ncbi:MAG TPA: hypothetical protein VFQ61_21280, partial [Polyangiaceae bacterium]|nr:hypothetical protein [Polyangiaceae bacterium]
ALPRTEPMPQVAPTASNSVAVTAAERAVVALRPEVPEVAHEVFFPAFNKLENVTYTPGLYARAKLHFVDKKLGLDAWQSYERWVPVLPTDADPRFSAGSLVPPIFSTNIAPAPLPGSQFEPLPPCLQVAKKYAAFRKAFAQYLYESEAFVLWRAPALKLSSEPGETEPQFRARVEVAAREARDEALEDLQEDYREEFEKLQAKLEKAQAKLDRERAQSREQALDTALSVGTGLLGALLGRKVASQANVRRAGRVGRSGAKAARARVDVAQAEQSRELLEQAIEELEREFHSESARVSAELDPAHIDIEEQRIPPRKADINVETLQLAWRPD